MSIGKEIIPGMLFECSSDCFFIHWTRALHGAVYPDENYDDMTGWTAMEEEKKVEEQTGMTHLFPCYFPESNGIGGKPGDCFLLFEDEDITEDANI